MRIETIYRPEDLAMRDRFLELLDSLPKTAMGQRMADGYTRQFIRLWSVLPRKTVIWLEPGDAVPARFQQLKSPSSD